jgi:hypothetical protein
MKQILNHIIYVGQEMKIKRGLKLVIKTLKQFQYLVQLYKVMP